MINDAKAKVNHFSTKKSQKISKSKQKSCQNLIYKNFSVISYADFCLKTAKN